MTVTTEPTAKRTAAKRTAKPAAKPAAKRTVKPAAKRTAKPTAAKPAAARPLTGEEAALEAARDQLHATLAAAAAAHPDMRVEDITSVVVATEAPYAMEKRLILGTLAARSHVMAVGTSRLAGGQYRRGMDVTLYGYASLIEQVTERYTRLLAAAETMLATVTEPKGEDRATFSSSYLLGFRLGLREQGLDRETVEKSVRAKLDPAAGVGMRSTGSGAWAGYELALAQVATTDQAA